jgi:enoyl-CoA hydratase
MSDDMVQYEVVDERIAVITLNRADKANAQTPAMLDLLDAAMMKAAGDKAVRVIVLQANGKHFSAGPDISGSTDRTVTAAAATTTTTTDDEFPLDLKTGGLEAIYEWETKRYLGYARKWRDIRKPTIAAVQGQCIAGGLLLCWPMDIIIASENAKFSDPVVRMGIGGVEYHGHTWEVGARKAKEWLFTASVFTAEQAEKLGMVNHVVPLDDLRTFTMNMAAQIAQMHPFALAQAKRAVNQTQDVQGFYAAVQSVFDIHQTGHGHAMIVNGYPILVDLEQMKQSIAKS